MPVASSTPSSELKLLWAQLRIFPTGDQNLSQHVYSYSALFACMYTSITVHCWWFLSPGDAVCPGFTMGKSQDWLFECFKQSLFPYVSVSEGKTRLVKTLQQHHTLKKWTEDDGKWYLLFVWQNSDIKLLAAVYNVRGDFLRWEQLGANNLQVKHSGWWYKWKLHCLGSLHIWAIETSMIQSAADLGSVREDWAQTSREK